MSVIRKLSVYGLVLGAMVALFFVAHLYAENSQREQAEAKVEDASTDDSQSVEAVKICRIFPVPLTDILKLPGTVEAYEDIDLATQLGGTIDWIGPREGDQVRKDEKLLQIDVAAYQAQLNRAQASHDLAQTKLKRLDTLRKEQIISPDQFDDAQATLKTSQAALEEAKVNLAHGTLTSPIDGVLDRRYADPGEHIEAGKTVMKIVHIDTVKVMLNIPEKDVLNFKRGQTAEITFSNGETHSFTGTVDWIAMTADDSTRTYPMKVIIDNPDHLLRPGMIVEAHLVRRRIDEAVVVPFFTINDREDGKAVYVVEDGVAHERRIEYGIFNGGMVEIVSGLKPDDALVVVGQRKLVDGQRVKVAQDVTDLARQYITQGGDLSKLMLDLSR